MKTILILEDEPSLMNLLHRVLNRYGYATLQARDAEEALRRFADNGRQIDLLLADVILPKVSGIHVALLLRTELSDLGVILMSGYPSSEWSGRYAADLRRLGSDTVGTLQKPFTPQCLLKTIVDLVGVAPTEALRTGSRATSGAPFASRGRSGPELRESA